MKKRRKKRAPKTTLKSTDYLTVEQICWILQILRNEAEGGTFRALTNLFLFELLLITGLRCCEVVGLEMRDLPQFHGKDHIDIRWQVAKNSRARRVMLGPKMVKEIGSFVDRFRPNSKRHCPLLINENGRRMRYWNVYSRIKSVAKKTGIEWLHPHALRHTYCSLLYGRSKDIFFVQEQAGHVRPETTKIYTHIHDTERKMQVSGLDWLVTT